jgi:hypothetical protein
VDLKILTFAKSFFVIVSRERAQRDFAPEMTISAIYIGALYDYYTSSRSARNVVNPDHDCMGVRCMVEIRCIRGCLSSIYLMHSMQRSARAREKKLSFYYDRIFKQMDSLKKERCSRCMWHSCTCKWCAEQSTVRDGALNIAWDIWHAVTQ